MNGVVYLDMLDEFLVPVRIWKKCIPRHKAYRATLLDPKFPGKWTGRCDSITQAPHSLDFKTTYLFFLKYIQDAVQVPILSNTLPEFAKGIRAATAKVTPTTFSKVKTSLLVLILH
jgi:hypothetical protein